MENKFATKLGFEDLDKNREKKSNMHENFR